MYQWLLKALAWSQIAFTDLTSPINKFEPVRPILEISNQWQVLGPFQIGTREATWGADPLEYLGGFRNLQFHKNTTYHSSLGSNGQVRWSIAASEELCNTAKVVEHSLTVDFTGIDWKSLQSVYGWAALQYQGWVRGELKIIGGDSQTAVIYVDNVLEFWIDGTSYFGGDFYAYRRAPLVLHLSPGSHQIDVRLVRDVRAMGGVGGPSINLKIRVEVSLGGLRVVDDKLHLPEVTEGHLFRKALAFVTVRNDGLHQIEIIGVESMESIVPVSLPPEPSLRLAPGQSRPLLFYVSPSQDKPHLQISFRIRYTVGQSPDIYYTSVISANFTTRRIDEPTKMTFLHPSGVVSYAIVKSPSRGDIASSSGKSLPILLNLHGAGLEADSEQVRHMMDSVTDLKAWIIFPTGGTSWSGDDWHTWGSADVDAAVAALPYWISNLGFEGTPVSDDIYVCGHSNGGQGTWFALTHNPDRVKGAAPVSGYTSMQHYVPYQFWHEVDPKIASVLQASLVSYRHELFVDNFAGIPVIQQHGSADDNVPAYHSRRLNQLTAESGFPSRYDELPGKGHWFDGVMTTEALRAFYQNISASEPTDRVLPKHFRFVVPNSGDMGSRGGIMMDQLMIPDQLGVFEVGHDEAVWTVKTSNILRFHFVSSYLGVKLPTVVILDGRIIHVPVDVDKTEFWFVRAPFRLWTLSYDKQWRSVKQRYGAQVGALDALLRTQGPISIMVQYHMIAGFASQIARNLFQYFGADCEIYFAEQSPPSKKGNSIRILWGTHQPLLDTGDSIEIGANAISLVDALGDEKQYPFEEGLGLVYLRPLPGEKLELVIWGFDEAGLRQASRLVPMLTGVGQPDFVVLSKRCAWQGAGGVLAMGFFDYAWRISQASYLS